MKIPISYKVDYIANIFNEKDVTLICGTTFYTTGNTNFIYLLVSKLRNKFSHKNFRGLQAI